MHYTLSMNGASDGSTPTLGVREAAKRLGVHENTIRNWVRDGQLDDVRLAGSRFIKVRTSEVERLIAQRGSAAVSLTDELRIAPPTLAGVAELDRWAETLAAWPTARARDAQESLPELVRRLLLETPQVSNIRVEAGDGIAQHGWDASFIVERPHSILPSGDVVVEMGTNKQVKRKADHDWAQRAADGPFPHLTYVFITPRRWAAGADWARVRRNERVFADVRVIDAPGLEAWLRQAPGAHHWLSEHLDLVAPGVTTLEQWWSRFRTSTDPTIPADFFSAGRSRHVETLRELLQRSSAVADRARQQTHVRVPAHIRIRTDWSPDGYAFVRAAIRHRPTGDPSNEPETGTDAGVSSMAELIAEPMVITDRAAWAHIIANSGQSVLIPTFDDADIDAAINAGHTVISVASRDHLRGGVDIDLPRLGRDGAAEALISSGVDFYEAHTYAALARRSLPALMRTLARDHRRTRPAWASGEHARTYGNLVLAGGWRMHHEGDYAALGELTGADPELIGDLVAATADSSDPLFRRSGDDWVVAAPEEALLAIAPRVSTTALRRWQSMAVRVLNVPDPRHGLSETEWLTAQLAGTRPPYSSKLRESVAYVAALLGSAGDDQTELNDSSPARPSRGGRRAVGFDQSDAARFRAAAASLVGELLIAAAEDASAQTWIRIAPFLPRLAEAAPEVFLDAVEADLALHSPLLQKLFQPRTSSFFGPTSLHVHLLWALESLAWSEDYLVRTARLLTQLVPMAAEVGTGNHPLSSLSTILCGWTRNTAASFDTRIAAVDAAIRVDPIVGWDLLLRLWPSNHATSLPPARPIVRDWEPEPGVPMAEWVLFVNDIVERAIPLMRVEPTRLIFVVDRLGTLPSADRAKVIDLLEASSPGMSDEVRLGLWEAISETVAKNRNYEDADWAMGAETVDRLAAVAARLDPVDDPRRTARLFNHGAEIRRPRGTDFAQWRDSIDARRRDAVSEVMSHQDASSRLAQLAEHVERPHPLAWALAETPEVSTDLMLHWLDGEPGVEDDSPTRSEATPDHSTNQDSSKERPDRRRAVAQAWLDRAIALRDLSFAAELLQRPNLSTKVHESIVLAIPARKVAWQLLDDDPRDAELFWSQAPITVVALTDVVEAITRLLEHGRAWSAIEVCSFALHELQSRQDSQTHDDPSDDARDGSAGMDVDLVARVLFKGLKQSQSSTDQQMSAHHVSELLDHLAVEGAGDDVLAPLEFAYLTLLDDQRAPAALSRTLAREPDWFVDLVSKAYRRRTAPDIDPAASEAAEEDVDVVFAGHCWRVLRHWQGYPGQDHEGNLDPAAMRTWVKRARLMLSEKGRADIGDESIGQALSNCSTDPDDGAWPHRAVRDLLEDIGSRHIESGLYIGKLNQRGVTSRSPYSGGRQERDIADTFRAMIPTVAGTWPRTARILGDIVRSYERDAERNDKQAEQQSDQF